MCKEKYLNFDPCSVTAEDVKRGPGWQQPDKAYAQCLKDGFGQEGGNGTSLNVGSERFVCCVLLVTRLQRILAVTSTSKYD